MDLGAANRKLLNGKRVGLVAREALTNPRVSRLMFEAVYLLEMVS